MHAAMFPSNGTIRKHAVMMMKKQPRVTQNSNIFSPWKARASWVPMDGRRSQHKGHISDMEIFNMDVCESVLVSA